MSTTAEAPAETGAQDNQESEPRYVIDRKAAAVAAVALKEASGHPVLSCVAVQDGMLVASDGFALLAVEMLTDVGAPPLPPLLPADLVHEAADRLRPDHTVRAAKPTVDGSVALAAARGRGRTIAVEMPLPPRPFEFPHHRTVAPTDAPQASVAVDLRRLRALLDAIENAGAFERGNTVVFRLHGPNRALELRAVDGEGRKIRAFLMPMVLGSEPPPELAWLTAVECAPADEEDTDG